MNGLFWPHADGADWKLLLRRSLGLAGVAAGGPRDDHLYVSLVGQCARVQHRNPQSDSNLVDVVPGFDVVKSHHQEIELLVKLDGELFNVHMMGMDVQEWVDLLDRFSGHQGLGVPFVLSLE